MNTSSTKRWMILLLVLLALAVASCVRQAAVVQPEEPARETDAQEPVQETAEETAQEKGLSPEEQKAILEENRALWAFPDEPWSEPWFYTFTDLDHNGRLEVLAASTQGSGLYTYVKFYELRADGSGLDNLYHEGQEIEGADDWPEIVMDSLDCYYDGAADAYYYVCDNVLRISAAEHHISRAALCLKDGVAEWETLATCLHSVEGDLEKAEYRDASGAEIDEAAFAQAAELRFAGLEKSELKLDWIEAGSPAPEG